MAPTYRASRGRGRWRVVRAPRHSRVVGGWRRDRTIQVGCGRGFGGLERIGAQYGKRKAGGAVLRISRVGFQLGNVADGIVVGCWQFLRMSTEYPNRSVFRWRPPRAFSLGVTCSLDTTISRWDA